MGLMDAILTEDRIDVKFSDFYNLVKNSAKAELMLNGIKNKIDHDSIYTIVTGSHLLEQTETEEREE